MDDKETLPCECETCKHGSWKRNGGDATCMDDECGGCCSWNDKYEPLETN